MGIINDLLERNKKRKANKAEKTKADKIDEVKSRLSIGLKNDKIYLCIVMDSRAIAVREFKDTENIKAIKDSIKEYIDVELDFIGVKE